MIVDFDKMEQKIVKQARKKKDPSDVFFRKKEERNPLQEEPLKGTGSPMGMQPYKAKLI